MKAKPPRILQHVLGRVLPPAVLTLAAIWLGATLVAQRAVQTELDERLSQQAAHAVATLSRRLGTLREATRALASNDLLVNGLIDLERRAEYLPVFFRSLRIPGPDGARIAMTDYRGRPVVSNYGADSFEGSGWLDDVMAGGEVFEISSDGVRIAVPVVYSGRPEGVIVVEYGAETVPEILRLASSAEALVVLGATGRILYSSNAGFVRSGAIGLDEDDDWMQIHAPVPAFPELSVVSAEPTTRALASVHRLGSFMLFAVALDILALIGGIVWTGLLVTKPLSQLVGKIRRLQSPESLREPIEPFGPAEIQELVRASNSANEELEREISARRQAQEQLAEAVENMSEGFVIYDAHDRLVLSNKRNREIYGESGELFVSGAHIEDILRGSMQRGQYGDVATGGEEWIAWRLDRFRNPSGVFVEKLSNGKWVQIHERKTKDGRTFGVRTDITELKEGEKALRLLEQTAVAANEATDPEDAMQTCLDLVCAHTGWSIGHVHSVAEDSTEELVSTTLWHLKHPERFAPFREVCMATRFAPGVGLAGRVLASGAPAWIADVTKDPHFLWTQLAEEIGIRAGFAFPVLIGADVAAVLEFYSEHTAEPDERLLELLDLTMHICTQLGRVVERRRAEEEHAELERELSQAQKLESLGTLAGGIAHEINTPLQFISDNTRFLKTAFSDLSVIVQQHVALLDAAIAGGVPTDTVARAIAAVEAKDTSYLLEEIPGAIEHSIEGLEQIAEIVQAIKEFSYPNTKEKSLIDINHAITTTVTVSRNQWKHTAELVTDFHAALPLVPCLPGELTQVILNLIINAAHTIEETAGDSKGRITISTRRVEDWAEIRISDTGCGIPEENRDKVFEPFFTTKEPGMGTGQGLAISHTIIRKKHNGTLTFNSEVGKGTEFIIRLPLVERDQSEAAA